MPNFVPRIISFAGLAIPWFTCAITTARNGLKVCRSYDDVQKSFTHIPKLISSSLPAKSEAWNVTWRKWPEPMKMQDDRGDVQLSLGINEWHRLQFHAQLIIYATRCIDDGDESEFLLSTAILDMARNYSRFLCLCSQRWDELWQHYCNKNWRTKLSFSLQSFILYVPNYLTKIGTKQCLF